MAKPLFSLTSFVQAELERPQSSHGEEEESGDEDEVEEQEGRSEKRQFSTQSSRVSLSPTQPVRSSLLFLMGQHDERRAEDVFVYNVSYEVSQTKLNDFL